MMDPALRSENGSGRSALIAHVVAAIEIADNLSLDIIAAHLASALALVDPGIEPGAAGKPGPTE